MCEHDHLAGCVRVDYPLPSLTESRARNVSAIVAAKYPNVIPDSDWQRQWSLDLISHTLTIPVGYRSPPVYDTQMIHPPSRTRLKWRRIAVGAAGAACACVGMMGLHAAGDQHLNALCNALWSAWSGL